MKELRKEAQQSGVSRPKTKEGTVTLVAPRDLSLRSVWDETADNFDDFAPITTEIAAKMQKDDLVTWKVRQRGGRLKVDMELNCLLGNYVPLRLSY
jgi:hypothetical protein